MTQAYREMVSLPYTKEQLRALWSVASRNSIDAGGVWDPWVASLHCYSKAREPWDGEGLPIHLFSLHFSWGNAPRLWAVERRMDIPESTPWLALAVLEETALGATLHGPKPRVGPTP